MFYESELKFLQKSFEKCRLQTRLLDIDISPDLSPDENIGNLLRERDIHFLINNSPRPEQNVVYKLTDPFSRTFIFFVLPDGDDRTVLLIGPYYSVEMTHKKLSALSEKAAPGPEYKAIMDKYLMSIPYLPKESQIFIVLDTFYELIWGDADNFTITDLNVDKQIGSFMQFKREPTDPEKTAWNMQLMEQRYAYENELMHAVAHGQTHKSELLLSAFSSIAFEERAVNPVQNVKNYCIIMNTLLRKAAESGGVHPVYLDTQSSAFAHKIEKLVSVSEADVLMTDMYRSYCRLVRKHSMKHYSPPIQKVVAAIDFDLTANLSLNSLAEMQNISPSYLSALFKQEVGKTLTEYVNGRRIERAMQLLETTKLQIQTIAQNCGILDVHYFSKIFKRNTGMTPKEYRASFLSESHLN